jgi:DMATS type aromatic prenyltransferase
MPHMRAALEGVTDFRLVKTCMSELGFSDSWEPAASYLQSMPDLVRPSIAMVAVDCLEPAKNRIKVYVRTQSSSFSDIADLLTLGGLIADEYVCQTLSAMRHLWSLLFPGVADDVPLSESSTRDAKYYPPGFLIYYELALGRAIPIPKVYIPVRRYCDNDEHIASALSQYFKDVKLDDIGESYKSDLERVL